MADYEALVGPEVVVDGAVLTDHGVIVGDGRIAAVLPTTELPAGIARRDLGSGLLTPGLIDVHTHGAAGHSFNEESAEAHELALSAYLSAGVTTILPTIAAAPMPGMLEALETIRQVKGTPGLPRIAGAHLEGPYFSQAQRGAQDPRVLRAPSDGSIESLLEFADVIRMVSFAPELPGAVALTKRLTSLGIIAAAGHSDARDSDLFMCQAEGLSHIIHVFSGQSTTIRSGPWRQPGLLEASLTSDDLTVEMIADGKHLPATLMKLIIRCLLGRVCLVSDSTPGAGMPNGSTYRMGEQDFLVENGVGVTLDRSSFGGSTTLISDMLPIVAALGVAIPDVVAMATAVPAAAMKLEDVGRIAPGFQADFALFDHEFSLQAVGLAGKW